MDAPRWIKTGSLPKLYRTRPECVRDNSLCSYRKLDFGLLGYAWCAFHGTAIRMFAGGFARTYECHLYNGHIIGFRDRTEMDGTPFERGWRDSMERTIHAECGLPQTEVEEGK